MAALGLGGGVGGGGGALAALAGGGGGALAAALAGGGRGGAVQTVHHRTQRVTLAVPTAAPMRNDVLFYLDTSGSTAGAALRAIKKGAVDMYDFLDAKDGVALASFASEITPLLAIGDKRHAPAFAARVDALAAGGQTVLYDAVVHAMAAAKASHAWNAAHRPADRRVPRVVILTDGEDTGSAAGLDAAAAAVQHPGMPTVKVFLIAVGAARATPAVRRLGALHGVEVVEAADAASIEDAFKRVRTTIRKLTLEVETVERRGVAVRRV